MVDSLNKLYNVPTKLVQGWLAKGYLIPLLDGLDEVNTEHQADCVEAINTYINQAEPAGLVVCCRLMEYQWLPERLKMNGAICIELLSREQIDSYFNAIGDKFESLRIAVNEDAVLQEFDRITERGGVLGAMETMYQRSKIQEESLYYETLKHTGEFPIIGVNTFLSSKGSPTIIPAEVIRATEEEKRYQIRMLENLHQSNPDKVKEHLNTLQEAATKNENLFEHLMEATKVCSLGQITAALFEVGGQYRRNM